MGSALRRIVLIAAIVAAATCGLTSVPAGAASPASYGARCVTVHSAVHGRSGTICAQVDAMNGAKRSEVTFATSYGPLASVSVTTLELLLGGRVLSTLHNVTKGVLTIIPPITDNWWDEPSGGEQTGVYQACMTWRDGDRACTGSAWLYSLPYP